MSRFDSFLKASLDSSFVKRRGVLVRSSSPRAFEFACRIPKSIAKFVSD